jgi:uncharacterized Fe-S cluster-containing radical SAM superfamily protein
MNTYELDEDDFNSEIVETLRSLCERYMLRSNNQVFSGRNRNVFILNNNIVVKIPICLDGFIDNDWEGSVSNADDDPEKIRLARTRLVYYKGVPILFMEYVEYAGKREIVKRLGYEPDWVMSVDSGQVGFNAKNQLVAFDYGRT